MKSNKSKTFFHEIAFLAVLNFFLFPSSKVVFWPFLKLQKMEFGQKKFVKLIYLISQIFLAHYAITDSDENLNIFGRAFNAI